MSNSSWILDCSTRWTLGPHKRDSEAGEVNSAHAQCSQKEDAMKIHATLIQTRLKLIMWMCCPPIVKQPESC